MASRTSAVCGRRVFSRSACGTSSYTSIGAALDSSQLVETDTRIEQAVADVRDEVSKDHQQPDHDRDSHDQRVVVIERRIERELTHAGIREDLLDDERAAEQIGNRD